MSKHNTPFRLSIAALSVALAAQAQANGKQIEEVEVRGNAISQNGLSLMDGNSAGGRLGLSLFETPASVELIDKSAIAIKGDYSGLAAVTRATGIVSSGSPGNGGTAVSSRGFNGHSSVVYTYDGTRLYVGSGTVSFPADTWTVDRVEVLRGPGSVINGVGAIGATINYVPKKPTLGEVSSEIDLTLGSNSLQRLAVGSGGGLSETLGYRVDVVKHKTDGYIDRAEEDRTAISSSLLFQPGENFFATLSIDFADTEAAPYWGTPVVNGDIPSGIRRNNYNVEDGIVAFQDTWPRLHLEWQLSDTVLFRNDTFYMEVERRWRNVEFYNYNETTTQVDRSFYLEIIHEQEQLGNRSDFLFDLDMAGMHSHLSVGAEFNEIDFSHINNRPYGGSNSVDLFNPVPGTWAQGVADPTTRDFDSETSQHALFIDWLTEINEQWSVVAGIRRDKIDYERVDLTRSNGETAGEIDADLGGTSWRLGAVFKPTSSTSLYAQASKAFDPIGSILSTSNPTLDLTKGEQIELGIKQQLMDGRVQYTVAFYDIAKKDIQSQDEGGVTRQIGEQSSRGIEFDLFLLALDNLSIDLNAAISNPEYDEFVSGGVDFSGNTPRRVPEKTANLWVTWQVDSAWSVGAGARYVGERYINDANTAAPPTFPSSKLPSYTVWDASVQWRLDDATTFTLRGKNLTDTDDYILNPGSTQVVLGDGRTGELSVNYSF